MNEGSVCNSWNPTEEPLIIKKARQVGHGAEFKYSENYVDPQIRKGAMLGYGAGWNAACTFISQQMAKEPTPAAVPYQRCPICEGAGLIMGPISTALSSPCPTCNGARIIPMHISKPSKVWRSPSEIPLADEERPGYSVAVIVKTSGSPGWYITGRFVFAEARWTEFHQGTIQGWCYIPPYDLEPNTGI